MVPMTRLKNTVIIRANDQEGSLQGCAITLKSVNLTVYFKGYLYQRIGFDSVLFFPYMITMTNRPLGHLTARDCHPWERIETDNLRRGRHRLFVGFRVCMYDLILETGKYSFRSWTSYLLS